MDRRDLARLRYPFPTLVNPHAAAIQELTERDWIDGALSGVVTAGLAEKFKKTRTGYMTSYFYPMATWERLVPLARMMIFSLYQDDLFEQAHPDHVRYLREHTVAAARGETTVNPVDVPLAGWIRTIRSELHQFIRADSVIRWASDLDLYFDGLIAETTLLRTGAYPTVDDHLAMREKTLMLHPFMALIEVETGVVLPSHVHNHPTVKRLKALAVRIIGYFNEIQSFGKDQNTGMDNVNLISVLMRQRGLSLEDAREHVLGLHADELTEFVQLQSRLPDFGDWHDATANHIHHTSFIISGWRGVDRVIQRYDPESYIDQDELRANVPTRARRR